MDNVTNFKEFKRAKNEADLWRLFRNYSEIFAEVGGSAAPLGRPFDEDKFVHLAVRNILEVGAEFENIHLGVWEVSFSTSLKIPFASRSRRDDDPTEPEVYALFKGSPGPVNMSDRMVGVKPVEVLVAYSQTYPSVNNAYMLIPVCDALVEYWDRGFVVMDYDLRHGDRRALLLTMGHKELGEVTLTFYYNVIVEDNRVLERLDREDASDDE